MEIYYVLEIAFNESNYDKIYNELYINGISAIIEEDGIIKVFLPGAQSVTLHTIEENLINSNTVNHHSIFISQFDNKDWNKEWERSIEPVYIKDKIIICPSWKKDSIEDKTNKILIVIDPKMSFGTGHNETTQLILELMCDYLTSDDNLILDFGCGTGILSIAALKLGLKKAVAIDIDDTAIENAYENFKINGVDKNALLYRSDISGIREKDFDVICANITSSVMMEHLNHIYNKLNKGSKLFLTGVLKDEKAEIKSALIKNKFGIREIRDKGDWSGFYAIKTD